MLIVFSSLFVSFFFRHVFWKSCFSCCFLDFLKASFYGSHESKSDCPIKWNLWCRKIFLRFLLFFALCVCTVHVSEWVCVSRFKFVFISVIICIFNGHYFLFWMSPLHFSARFAMTSFFTDKIWQQFTRVFVSTVCIHLWSAYTLI